jgi:hypothetical protein
MSPEGHRHEHDSHSFPEAAARPGRARRIAALVKPAAHGLALFARTFARLPARTSIEEAAEQQQESVAVALQQIEKVIGMIQLMREYLDAEHPGRKLFHVRAGAGFAERDRRPILDRGGARSPVAPGGHVYGDIAGAGVAAAAGFAVFDCDDDRSATGGR